MRKNDRQKLLEALEELPKNIPIKYAKMEKIMERVFPHLAEQQTRTLFINFLNLDKDIRVAVPSIFVANTIHVVSLSVLISGPKELFRPSELNLGSPRRVDRHFTDTESLMDVFYVKEAIEYAKDYWGKKLIVDNWQDYVQIYLKDPLSDEEESVVTTIHVAVACKWEDILRNHRYPLSLIIDENIVEATLNPIEGWELQGSRTPKPIYNCAYCGSGITMEGCRMCGGHGVAKPYSWSTPLPPSLMALLLDSGYSFKEDRLFASQEDEYNNWKRRHFHHFQ